MSLPAEQVPPIFVVGSPRSGTTMLAGLLEDTMWGNAFETHFITKYYRRLRAFGDLTERHAFCRLAGAVLDERPIAQRRLGLTPEGLFDTVERHDYASLVDAIGKAYGGKHGHVSWGDKTPHYILDLEILHELFPRSKMVYIVRDGRDVALSLLKKPWGPANVYTCARQWRYENRPREILITLRAKGLLHDVRYEDLLRTPEVVLTGIMRFLDHPTSPDALAKLKSSIRSENSGKWSQQMSAGQIEAFERVAGDSLRLLGFPVTHDPGPVPAIRVLAYRTQDLVKRAVNLFKMNVIDTVRIRFFGMEPFAD